MLARPPRAALVNWWQCMLFLGRTPTLSLPYRLASLAGKGNFSNLVRRFDLSGSTRVHNGS